MTTTTTIRVNGMSCEHCVKAVTGALASLPAVSDVTVHLASGNVTITSAAPLDGPAMRAAVEDAGYELGTSSG